MEQKLTKELAKKLIEIKGETRGVVFKTDGEYILREKGKKALEKVEKEMARLGHPIKYEQIQGMGFYPIGLRALALLVIKKVLNFDKKEIEQMGRAAPKASLIMKFFMKYFVSIKILAKQAPKIWEEHYTVGELDAEVPEKERYIILRLKGLNLHPVFCTYLAGYFATTTQMVVKGPVVSEETKCTFKGDRYHEYLLKW